MTRLELLLMELECMVWYVVEANDSEVRNPRKRGTRCRREGKKDSEAESKI